MAASVDTVGVRAARLRRVTLAGASLVVLAAIAAPEFAAAQDATLGEIVVTARRQSESLQNVPSSVVPITGEALQQLQLRNTTDIQRLVPGLRLAPPDRGSGGVYSLRGTTFDVTSGQFSSIAFYVNDAAMQASHVFDGGQLFDVGQIEVLRGPQGTNRGISAPSGAITISTRTPNLEDYGGYIDGLVTDMHGRNVNGAINIPIVKDVFGVRIAGAYNDTQGNFARAYYPGSARPRFRTYSSRVSLRFTPSELFEADLMYEHRLARQFQYEQVAGNGRPVGALRASPPLRPEDRASAESYPYHGFAPVEMVTGRVRSHFAEHTLEFVGGYGYRDSKQDGPGDITGIVPGDTLKLYSNPKVRTTQASGELRLSSDPAPDKFLDYSVGLFYQWFSTRGISISSRTLLPGAFGAPGTVLTPTNIQTANRRYILDVAAQFDQYNQEFSGFASATAHIGHDTDLTGGIRQMRTTAKAVTGISAAAFSATNAIPLAACNTAGRVPDPFYPGFCDVPVTTNLSLAYRKKESPTLYNINLTHRFTPDFMVYGATGTAYRPSNASVGVAGSFITATNPLLQQLVFHPSEKSKNYELGFKSQFLDRRARLNVTIFQQKFKGFQVRSNGIRYLNTTVTPNVVASQNFSGNANVRVRGVDVDAALKITPEWDAGLQFSYNKDKVGGAGLPCNLGTVAAPTFNTDGVVSFCNNLHANREAPYSATLTTNYEHPVADGLDAFVRGLGTYYAKNNRQPEIAVKSYALLNAYVGVRAHDGAWEASLFVRNLLNTFRVTGREADLVIPSGSAGFPALVPAQPAGFTQAGYYLVRVTPPREFGVNVRYAFGSR